MAEKMTNDIIISSSSKYEDAKINTEKRGKRNLSISEDEDEYNNHTTETSTNEKTLCMDGQTNSIRTSKQSLSDVIQQLTQQIEHIENVARQNVIKKTEMNDINYDDEFMYQPPNKIIKYGIEMSTDSCHLDENSIRSINKINSIKHVNKKIKLDKNTSYQKNVNDFKRDTKSLTNDEVQMLLELSYNFDDEIVFDNEDNTHIKVQTTEDELLDLYEEESDEEVIKQTIEDIIVSLDSSNRFCVDLSNVTKSVKDLENILEPVDDLCINENSNFQEPITLISNSNPEYELSKTVPEIFEHNNNDVIDSENIPDQAIKLNMPILLNETKLDNEIISISTEDENLSLRNDCSENNIIDLSEEFPNYEVEVNSGEVFQPYEYNFDNRSDSISTDLDDFIDFTKCIGDEIILDDDNDDISICNEETKCERLEDDDSTSKINAEKKNLNILKRSSHNEEEMFSKILNNEKDKLEVDKDCTDKIIVSQTCDDNFYENVSKAFINENDLLEVTRHTSFINEEKKSDRLDALNMSTNYENNETIFINNEIDQQSETSSPFNSSDPKRILESSNNDSEHSDDSLGFMPSGRDLVKYGIECEEHEKSISPFLNNLQNDISDTELVPQYKKFNEVSKKINTFVSSSSAKDYEDNVKYFYDCDISSIENSDEEDNVLLSFEKDSSIDNCVFVKNQDKLIASNSINNEQKLFENNSKIQDSSSASESCNNLSNVMETPVSLIYSPSRDHQYAKILSTSMSKKQISRDNSEVSILKNDIECCETNPDTDKLEILNDSNVKITANNIIPSINDSAVINIIQSDMCIDPDKFNEQKNLEDSNKSHIQNNEKKSISKSNTHQTINKSQKSYKNNESETIPKFNSKEEIAKLNTFQSCSSDVDQDEIDKKIYLEKIIKNEKLFNEFDEKLDVNETVTLPYISQSLAKSTNSRSALTKKAAANINIHAMGEKALCTYLTQQTMTLDVLEVLHKSLDTCPSSGVLMEDPEGLVVSLMPHQKHAIAWLIWRESQKPRGGILADDMGLGKTLSMISLVLKEKQQESLLPIVSIDNRSNDDIIGGTLIVCPASLLSQWQNEFTTKLKPGLLKVGQYYGINRNIAAIELAKNDVVMTSYSIIMWDYKKQQNSSPLFHIKWRRIILDEAHQIRNKKTQTSLAVCNMTSMYRWAITGTPIHNKGADFFTLLKFIRCHPFDDWDVWKRWVGNNDVAGQHRLSLIVRTLMLRRTKQELSKYTTFKIPTKTVHEIEIELSKEERNAYEKLLQFSSNLFATYLYDRAAKEKVFDSSIKVQCKVQYFQEESQDKDKIFKDHPELLKLFRKFKNIDEIQTYHILVLLLRLRQICCHPVLIKGPITEDNIKDVENIPEDFNEVSECNLTNSDSYCNEDTRIVNFPSIIDLSRLMSCLTLNEEPAKKNPELYNDNKIFEKSWISSKIKKICDLINEKVLNGNNEKAIIVSQWPSFLYLIRENLSRYDVKMEMFSGTIPILKRNKIIKDFDNPNGGPQILLLSLKAGGVGLNLMAANHLFLMDVHWNPQMEAQASDRVYRVGQKKQVNIYKFICANTIETRILNIQSQKLQIAKNLFEGSSAISSKITLDDLKQIFQFQ
ncbi:transcription termination factor 2-like isoform X3 [Aphis gossypii]|uniref:transcription termination factor 2-like isoform X1 n=1 Tax=Aphis gossypii TaxID=80765 RepID=UPI00215924B9|nr:transcription termination factor 2-like isoform X1 [Aphis gossypii]XP_050057918.1 transcription termination factor 2-like isoform X2 [Aphis gossypii]XP_050057919.1 transcription termination factor 2-like isoform X3 [Aphis gossypii]